MLHDKPLATEGLNSYRYKGRYGWIMIGALDTEGALKEAARSASDYTDMDNLQKWNGTEYVPA
jgi:hypothetical protein